MGRCHAMLLGSVTDGKPTKVRPFRIESLARLDILSVAYERGNFCTCRTSCWSSASGQGRPAHISMRCFARSCPSSERRLVPGGRSKDKDECSMAVHVRDPLGHSRDESRERLEARSDTVTLPTRSTHVRVICFRPITPIDQSPYSPSPAYSKPFAPRWNDRRPHASPYTSPRHAMASSQHAPSTAPGKIPALRFRYPGSGSEREDGSNISTAFEVTGTRPISISGSVRPCVQQPDYASPDHRCAPRRGFRSGCDARLA